MTEYCWCNMPTNEDYASNDEGNIRRENLLCNLEGICGFHR